MAIQSNKSMSFAHSDYVRTFYVFSCNGMRVQGVSLEVVREKPNNRKSMRLLWDRQWDNTTMAILQNNSASMMCKSMKDANAMVEKMCAKGEVFNNSYWAKTY